MSACGAIGFSGGLILLDFLARGSGTRVLPEGTLVSAGLVATITVLTGVFGILVARLAHRHARAALLSVLLVPFGTGLAAVLPAFGSNEGLFLLFGLVLGVPFVPLLAPAVAAAVWSRSVRAGSLLDRPARTVFVYVFIDVIAPLSTMVAGEGLDSQWSRTDPYADIHAAVALVGIVAAGFLVNLDIQALIAMRRQREAARAAIVLDEATPHEGANVVDYGIGSGLRLLGPEAAVHFRDSPQVVTHIRGDAEAAVTRMRAIVIMGVVCAAIAAASAIWLVTRASLPSRPEGVAGDARSYRGGRRAGSANASA